MVWHIEIGSEWPVKYMLTFLVAILLLNAISILSEDRFLARSTSVLWPFLQAV